MASETSTSRHIFTPWFKGLGIDLGFGGDLCHPSALGMDFPGGSYGSVGGDQQTFRGDVRRLPFLMDNCIDYLHSSHVLEDFHWDALPDILTEYWRVLKKGGFLLINCPYQDRFEAHCAKTGQGLNLAHANADFGLGTWNRKVVAHTGPWEVVFEEPNHGPYSWLQVLKKIQ